MGEAARVLGGGEADVLALALRAMADGVAIVDRASRIRFVNQALAEAWGAPASAIVGRPAADFVRLPSGTATLDTVLAAPEPGGWRGGRGPADGGSTRR